MASRSGGLRVSRGFYAELVSLPESARRDAIGLGAFIVEALELDELDVLSEWAMEGEPGVYVFPLSAESFVTLSVSEQEGAPFAIFERAGDAGILRQPRSEPAGT